MGLAGERRSFAATSTITTGAKWWEPTFSIGFCAPLYEPDGVFDELPAGLNKLHNLVHGV